MLKAVWSRKVERLALWKSQSRWLCCSWSDQLTVFLGLNLPQARSAVALAGWSESCARHRQTEAASPESNNAKILPINDENSEKHILNSPNLYLSSELQFSFKSQCCSPQWVVIYINVSMSSTLPPTFNKTVMFWCLWDESSVHKLNSKGRANSGVWGFH